MSSSDLADTMRSVLRESSFQSQSQSNINATACIVVAGVLVLLVCIGMFMTSSSPRAMSYMRKLQNRILPKNKKFFEKV